MSGDTATNNVDVTTTTTETNTGDNDDEAEVDIYENECNSDADCDNGLFCDGSEVCDLNTNTCEPGPEVCTGQGQTCDETTDQCVDPVCNMIVTKTADAGPYLSGATVTWTVEYENEGPDTCYDVVITDT